MNLIIFDHIPVGNFNEISSWLTRKLPDLKKFHSSLLPSNLNNSSWIDLHFFLQPLPSSSPSPPPPC